MAFQQFYSRVIGSILAQTNNIGDYLLRSTTRGIPMRSAPSIPDWVPATRMQLETGVPASSDPARNAHMILSKL
uniref:Uncharacterized protein n=1 Tax=Cucumis melo TaxID=3656 RepID=A0A9I9EF51_CUCME